jgi:hypothetical protein
MKGKDLIIKLTDPYTGQTFKGTLKDCITMLNSGENIAAVFLYDWDNINIDIVKIKAL